MFDLSVCRFTWFRFSCFLLRFVSFVCLLAYLLAWSCVFSPSVFLLCDPSALAFGVHNIAFGYAWWCFILAESLFYKTKKILLRIHILPIHSYLFWRLFNARFSLNWIFFRYHSLLLLLLLFNVNVWSISHHLLQDEWRHTIANSLCYSTKWLIEKLTIKTHFVKKEIGCHSNRMLYRCRMHRDRSESISFLLCLFHFSRTSLLCVSVNMSV